MERNNVLTSITESYFFNTLFLLIGLRPDAPQDENGIKKSSQICECYL